MPKSLKIANIMNIFLVVWSGVVGEQRRTGSLFLGVMLFYMIVLLCVLGKVDVDDRAVVVGSICVVIGSFMYSSPMTVIVRFHATI